MHFEIIKNLKPSVARKLAVGHASDLATGGLFHKIPCFFHDYSGFSNSLIFPYMELFLILSDFPGFP